MLTDDDDWMICLPRPGVHALSFNCNITGFTIYGHGYDDWLVHIKRHLNAYSHLARFSTAPPANHLKKKRKLIHEIPDLLALAQDNLIEKDKSSWIVWELLIRNLLACKLRHTFRKSNLLLYSYIPVLLLFYCKSHVLLDPYIGKLRE